MIVPATELFLMALERVVNDAKRIAAIVMGKKQNGTLPEPIKLDFKTLSDSLFSLAYVLVFSSILTVWLFLALTLTWYLVPIMVLGALAHFFWRKK
jgi:hypothetical protein